MYSHMSDTGSMSDLSLRSRLILIVETPCFAPTSHNPKAKMYGEDANLCFYDGRLLIIELKNDRKVHGRRRYGTFRSFFRLPAVLVWEGGGNPKLRQGVKFRHLS